MKFLVLLSSLFLVFLLTACDSNPFAKNAKNVCRIFRKNPRWFWEAQKSETRWQVPMSLMMAIIHQESDYQGGAEPPRIKLLRVIPWFRPSSAEGYAQATNATWRLYCRSRHLVSANRGNFSDAIDFVGWYLNYAHQQIGVAKDDPYVDYLIYHEGMGGYVHKTYRNKYWLKHVAHKVEKQAEIYHTQLASCMQSLPNRPWWF